MAIINAAANGLWSSAATWPGGVFPTSADDVFANNRTIYIDQNIDVLSLNTTAGAGGVAGGRFYVNQGNWTINAANIIQAGTTYCVTVTGTGTRTLSSQFFRASDTTTSTAGVLILGTTGLPNVITYGNAIGSTAAGSNSTNTPAGVTIEGGMLTHYGFISGGTATRSCGLKIYQAASSTIPVSAIVYGNVKGGTHSAASGIICEFSPATNTLSACTISVYGNLSGGDTLISGQTDNAGVNIASTIHTDIFGNVYGGSGYSVASSGLRATGSNIIDINIRGNVLSSPQGVGGGISYTSTLGNINLTGNVISQDTLGNSPASNTALNSCGIYQNGGTTLNILGNIYGCRGTRGFACHGIYLDATCTVNITGNVYGGNTGFANGIYCIDSPNIVNVYGNVYGNTESKGVQGHGIQNSTTASINVFGSAIASEKDNFSHGVYNVSTGVVYVKRAVANSHGVGSGIQADTPNYGVYSVSISGVNLVEEMVFGSRGQIPVFGPTYIVNTTTNSVTGIKSRIDIGATFLGNDAFVDSTTVDTLVPAISNVVKNITYGTNLTGTMVVPSVTSVSFDVPVGNTKGTVYLTPSVFWNTQTTQLTSLSTAIGYRLNNAATTEFIGNTLAAYNI